MNFINKAKHFLLLLLLGFLFAGCGMFQTAIDDVKILSVRFDDDFSKNGIINLNIVPVDVDGNLGSISSIKAVATYRNVKYVLTEEDLDVDKEDSVDAASSSLPWAVAVDIDSSGSMSSSDPDALRKDAAKLFVDGILDYNSSSQFNIYDFGAGSTTGFDDTRQLTSDWTSNQADIEYAINQVKNSGSTPMYDSIYEVLKTFVNEKTASEYQRSMLVLSDGVPDSTTYEQAVYLYAVSNSIPINTVSLGTGAYAETMRELAEKTGGIYASANEDEDLEDAFVGLSLGTAEGYIIYTLKFRDPEELYSGSSTAVKIKLTITAKDYDEVKTINLNS